MIRKTLASPVVHEQEQCFHCGADCLGNVRYVAEKPFCCDGCSTVFQILNENGLNAYYELNAHPGTKNGEGRYAFLDQAGIGDKILDFQSEAHCRITLQIPTIHCTSCIWLLEHLYQVQDGVLRSEVNFPKREAYLHFDPGRVSLRQLVELLDKLGYPPNLSLESLAGKKKPRMNRQLLYQLGVAGFCFGNIMLLSFPEYIGLADLAFARFFGSLNIGLAVPVVAYSARDYFRAALQGLRSRRINMDVPIALGIATLFLRSSYDIISGTGAGYLDSMAGLVFFLLIGKLYQSKTHAFLAFDRDYKSYFPIAVTRLQEAGEESVPISDVTQGDRLYIRNGEMIPADAVLREGEAFLDYSFVSGEADLVPRKAGDLLYAGGRQSGTAITIETVRPVSQSYLTQLWSHESFQKKQESRVTRLSNRAGRVFTLAILAIAAVTALTWLWIDPSQVVLVVTAVLIVACPCALALATPFALGNALRILDRNGLFLKGPAIVERMADIDSIVFDKTGTLTVSGAGQVAYTGRKLSATEQGQVGALLRQSTHPLSRQLAQEVAALRSVEIRDFQEIPGKGLQAQVGESWMRLGSAVFLEQEGKEMGQGTSVHLEIDGRYAGVFRMQSTYREGLAPLLAELAEGYELALLTGDTARDRARLETLFPDQVQLHYRQRPQDKLDFVQARREAGHAVLMLGDGLNDAGALQESTVGIALAEDIAAFTPASDAILSADSFTKISRFLDFSRSVIRLIHASFALSLLYNLIGLAFAVTGNLSPLVAAILMPASSVSVILFTTILSNWIAWRKKL